MKIIILLIIIVISVPIITAIGVNHTSFNLLTETNNKDWLNYWATYTGNIIGLIGLAFVTYFQDKKQNKYLSQQLQSENERLKLETFNNLIHENRELIRKEADILSKGLQIIKSKEYQNPLELNYDIGRLVNSINYCFSLVKQINDVENHKKFFSINKKFMEIQLINTNILIYTLGPENFKEMRKEEGYGPLLDENEESLLDDILHDIINTVEEDNYSLLEDLEKLNREINLFLMLTYQHISEEMNIVTSKISKLTDKIN